MMNKLFGRNEGSNVEELIGGLEARVDEQNRNLITTGTAVIELERVIENMRKYNEAMEVRLRRQSEAMVGEIKEVFEQGYDRAVTLIMDEVKTLGAAAKPKEVVKAIDTRTREEKKLRQYRTIKQRLESDIARHLMHDLPLVSRGRYKNGTLTPSGEAIYESISKFLVNMAKVSGVKKEQYTNRSRYNRFFKEKGIAPYNRASLRKRDGSQVNTLLAAIVENGHVRQYVDYIISILEAEKKKIETEENV